MLQHAAVPSWTWICCLRSCYVFVVFFLLSASHRQLFRWMIIIQFQFHRHYGWRLWWRTVQSRLCEGKAQEWALVNMFLAATFVWYLNLCNEIVSDPKMHSSLLVQTSLKNSIGNGRQQSPSRSKEGSSEFIKTKGRWDQSLEDPFQ